MPFLMSEVAQGSDAALKIAQNRAESPLVDQRAQASLLNEQSVASFNKDRATTSGLNMADLARQTEISNQAALGGGLSTQASVPDESKVEYKNLAESLVRTSPEIQRAQKEVALLNKRIEAVRSDDDLRKSLLKQRDDTETRMKDLQATQEKQQIDLVKKPLQSAFLANDQSSWNSAKDHLTEAQKQVIKSAALAQGMPEDQAKALAEMEGARFRKTLPEKFGDSSRVFVEQHLAELSSMEDTFKLSKEARDREKHKLDMLKTKADIAKLEKEADKGTNDPEKLGDALKNWNTIANTQSNIVNRDTPIELELADERIKAAEDARGGWFLSKGEETKLDTELKAAQAEKDAILIRKTTAERMLAKAQQKMEEIIAMSEASGKPVDKDALKPADKPLTSSDYSLSKEIASEFGSIEAFVLTAREKNPNLAGMTDAEIIQVGIDNGVISRVEKKSKADFGKATKKYLPDA